MGCAMGLAIREPAVFGPLGGALTERLLYPIVIQENDGSIHQLLAS